MDRAGLAGAGGGQVTGPAFAADTVYYYISDSLHSEVVITDANRNIVEQTNYAPYGRVLNRDLRDGPGYTGHEEDPVTGLVYMQQRYYDPDSGRFISTDSMPTTVDGGNFNRYWYAADNPYRYTDPTGMACTGSHITDSQGNCASTGGGTTGTNGAAEGMILAKLHAGTASRTQFAKNIDSAPVGKTTVHGLSQIMSNEIGGLSGGKKGDLQKAKDALASTIMNNAMLKHPASTAPATGNPSGNDTAVMRATYLDRALGLPDPVAGRTQYGTSRFLLKSRSASNFLKGPAGRETVYARFGPFDNSIGPPTYIYIYNNPGH